VVDQKQLGNVEYFNSFGGVITNDARGKGGIKCGIAMPKAAFIMKKTLFGSKLDLENLRKEPVKCYMWSVALCGADTGTVLHVECSFVWC